MIYPYLLYSPDIDHRPIFAGLEGAPYMADLSSNSPLLEGRNARDQTGLQAALDAEMAKGGHRWGVSPYLERRETLLGDCPQMAAEKRFIHLGLDVIVDLGTPLHAPLDGIVETSGYETGEGNYGGYVVLRHETPSLETFYSFFGHLCIDRLPAAGERLRAGCVFAEIGDFHENGNWFYHTHVQVITRKGFALGYGSKGYCSEADLIDMNNLCPSPIPLFKIDG
ncbi:MAG: peptidoglycan DD-metalloendopeptidase family protein [Desulfobacterales bacterium]|jgi:murein DD-endopeptidase MepM/ murein hydrolase activator NlpD